jgi:manganese-dependent inorganic pyrophosphatase
MREKEDHIYIVGHKNPDTDSISAAISYAYLKNTRTHSSKYVACRAGQINNETDFVLKYWKKDAPYYLPNVGMQVYDMDIDESEGAPDDITIRIAWEYMKESQTVTLPVMAQDGSLEGLLTVGDIANYYIDAYTKTIMSEAKTKYYDIAETINGTVVLGNEHGYFARGKVLVGAAQPEHLAQVIERDDLIILSDREDTQRQAIECGASCIVVCLSEDVSDEIKKLADEHMCVIICTKFDTYTVARLINQSIPAKSLMKRKNLVTFNLDDYVDDIRETMGKYRYRDFPVLDHGGKYIGMVSRRSLINVKRKQLILVDHTEESQAVENLDEAEILEIIDHHRIGTVETLQPVFFRGEPVGCTCTILTSMYEEQNVDIPKDIAGLMLSAILSDTLMFRSPTCTPRDEDAAKKLAEIAGVQIEDYAKQMFKAGSDLKGKTPDEIMHQDYKKFIFGDTVFGVGQISSMDADELKELEKTLRPQMEEECGKNDTTMIFFMLTNILTEDTTLMTYGKGSEELVNESFGVNVEDGSCVLKKVVSRKKQLIPAFMSALQNQQ